MAQMAAVDVKSAVCRVYGTVAVREDGSQQEGARRVAQAFGYSEEELASIPQEANMGLSCGNSVKYANLREGEVVVDLGSGGGLDCFLAAQKVGKTGSVIGVDMTEEMIKLATRNAAKMGDKASNIDFRKGEIENIPVDGNTADCVMSNCVLNLVPDKKKAFSEIYRILKPGGRLAASDIALKQPLPKELWNDLMAYVGCIAGAVIIDDYIQQLKDAGFSDVLVIDTGADLNAYTELAGSNCCAPSVEEISGLAQTAAASCTPSQTTDCCGGGVPKKDVDFGVEVTNMFSKFDVNTYAASVRVMALKPAAQR